MATKAPAKQHVIILMQSAPGRGSRTYYDFDTLNAGLDTVIKLYEKRLKELNPSLGQISYDIGDFFAFLDALGDLGFLVYKPSKKAYEPFGKDWIKKQCFEYLKSGVRR